MKHGRRIAFPTLLALFVLFGAVSRADAQEGMHTKWTAGLRGGPSFLTQDPVDSLNVEGQIGPVFNGLVLYDLNPYCSLGFEAEWEQHKTDQAAVTLGDASTASLLLRVEGHLERPQTFSPYILFACGYNLNFFDEEDAYQESCGEDCRIDIDNSFAIKAGFGVDMLVLFENAAINIEVAWKYNKADMDFESGGNVTDSGDYDGSALNLLFGFRYFFPTSSF